VSVFFYISGHGFGHASREIAVINALRSLAPELRVVVRTSAARWLFDRTIRGPAPSEPGRRVEGPFTYLAGPTDTGVVQIDSLHLDERQTIREAAEFHQTLPARAAEEAKLLREHDARLVISDAPALGCAAAAEAGITSSVLLSNFTWDWIYQAYGDELATAPDLIPTIQTAYRSARAAWRLPMHGGFETFDTIIELPLVARHGTYERDAVRRQLGLPLDVPVVLSSFGGYGVQDFNPERLDCLDAYAVVITTVGAARSEAGRTGGPLVHRSAKREGGGIYMIDESAIYDPGFHYEDLVAAVDVVATKPGYGIISECIANETAILYTSRGRFAEYDVLVTEMPRFLRCRYIPIEELLAGRWRTSLDVLMASPPPPERPRADGANVAARMVVEMMQG
jgi:hypothetical protein